MNKLFLPFLLSAFICSTVFAQDLNSSLDSLSRSDFNNPRNFKKLLDSSNNFYNDGHYTKSLELNLDILKMAFAMKKPYYIHQGYRYLAYDYLVLNDTVLAEENMKKSEYYAKLSNNDTATAVTFMDLANMYATNEKYEKALDFHDKSIDRFGKIFDSTGLAKANYNAVYTALEAKQYNKAFDYIVKAEALNKFGDHSSYSIGIDIFYGEYYVLTKKFKKADKRLLMAIDESKKEELNIELESAYYSYSESLYGQNRYREAYDAFKLYDELSDKNAGIYTSEERFALTEKHQLDEYRKDVKAAKIQNDLQQEIVKNKSRLNTLLIILSASFLILMITLFVAYSKRKQLVLELKQKNTEYLLAKEETEKLAKSKSKFFSTVSHELRTPLYGVIGITTLLLEDKSLKNHEKDLKSLKFSADYLMALINDVLHINKIDSKVLEDELTVFSVRELIESIVASFEYTRLQNKNRVYIQVSKNIPQYIKGNVVRLSQVLMNLIGNAYKFTESGEIYIQADSLKVSDTETTIHFLVKDNGVGIAKDKQKAIFDEFSQLDSLNYNYQGTGLGLPIVKKLLALSNSTIRLESALGKGSVFSFKLTFTISVKENIQQNVALLDTNFLKNKKILIVEDNRINQIVTQKILEKNKVKCYIAENGKEALYSIKENNFDLILMDLNMPIMDGFVATKAIREFNTTVPILALTAVEIEEVRNKIYSAGMNDIIVKPYDVTKFIQTIAKNIKEKGMPLVSGEDRKAI
jgi:two-component system, sensor histidine kinase